MEIRPLAILGAGSWGTALALNLSRRGQEIRIWSVDRSEIDGMLNDGQNKRFLPGHPLPKTLIPTPELAKAIDGVDDILLVVPSHGFRSTLERLAPLIKNDVRLISATKGIDAQTQQLMNEVALDVLGNEQAFAVLSGPTFAKEVALGLPYSVVIASDNQAFIEDLMIRFNDILFRTYPSHDVIGVEIGGVVKNVIAIATGVYDGMQLGANARSALITQGLAEIIRLGEALGGKQSTMIGLAGLGDLILTCSDDQSRNRRFGLALGQGMSVHTAEEKIGQVVEGKRNAELVVAMAKKYAIQMPICSAIAELVSGKITAKQAWLTISESA